MLKTNFKLAWRNLVKGKWFSFINITGLAIGMAVAMLVGLWIWDETSFNSSFKNHSHLAQAMINQTMRGETYTDPVVAMPLGNALRTRFSDDIEYTSLTSWLEDHVVAEADKKLTSQAMWVQQDLPAMLSLDMLFGNKGALKDPSSILINQSLSRALFGNADPTNKMVRLDNKMEFKIAGVFKDLPHNTSFFGTEIFLPWENKENWRKSQQEWDNHCGQLFVQLRENANFDITNRKIKNLPTPYIKDWKEEVMLQPFDRVHLYNEFKNAKEAGGRIRFVWLFGIIGIFVLFLACINFMNLSTARSEKRAREVGIRKTIGSLRSQLVWQFLSESLLTALIAFLFALLLVQISLNFFNELADKRMVVAWTNPVFWMLGFGFTVITGLLAGSYPAFYLSHFEPVRVLKGTFRVGRLASLPRKILVVVQFTVSITLIIGTMIVFRQIQFAKDRPVGYNRDGLIEVPLSTPDLYGHYDAIRNDLLQTGAVENMAESSYPATSFNQNNSVEWKGKDPGLVIFFRDVNVTADFGKTIGWEIKEGRDFSRDYPGDSGATTILNEAAAKIVGFKNPVGQMVKWQGKDHKIIGIVKNMVTQSVYDNIEPAIFFMESWMGVITIRLKPNLPIRESLAKVENVFKKYNPSAPFEYKFLDDIYAQKFSDEERIGNLATFFAILAIFISCLGLFGLASFVAEQRTKEIGVRKVLGASALHVWKMLTIDFLMLVVISCIISIPIAWFYLNNWLQHYVYRTQISWLVFAIAASGAMIITLLTVSHQALKAAFMNPIKSLRTE